MRSPYTARKDFWKHLDEKDFDPHATYTDRDLEMYANAILSKDVSEHPDGPRILFQEHIEPKWRREVSPGKDSKTGTVDSTLTNATSPDGQRMYNRQHPEGRKVNSKQQRESNGASYYR